MLNTPLSTTFPSTPSVSDSKSNLSASVSSASVLAGAVCAAGACSGSEATGASRYTPEVTSCVSEDGKIMLVNAATGEVVSYVKGSQEQILEARRRRFLLTDVAASVLRGFFTADTQPLGKDGKPKLHRTCGCHRLRISPTAQIVFSDEYSKAHFAGIRRCASAATCPLCSGKITERKALEIRTALNQCPALGLKAHLITFTAPHTAGDDTAELIDKMSAAMSAFWREFGIRKSWMPSRGVIGNIRSFEVKFGINGAHPHFHLIVFSRRSLKNDTETLLSCWKNVAVRVGLKEPNEYGLDIRDGTQAGEYISKLGSDGEVLKTKAGKEVTWDAADEMTRANAKSSKDDRSFSPFDLLAVAGGLDEVKTAKFKLVFKCNDERAVELARAKFLDYSRAIKHKMLIKWSRGLRAHFELGKEQTDEQIVASQTENCRLLSHISPDEWTAIVKKNARALVLELAENGGAEAVARWIHGAMQLAVPFEQFLEAFMRRDREWAGQFQVVEQDIPVHADAQVKAFEHRVRSEAGWKEWSKRVDPYASLDDQDREVRRAFDRAEKIRGKAKQQLLPF